LIVWWGWPFEALGKPFFQEGHNISIFPWGLPIAALLLYLAWRSGQDWLGVIASPLLLPYMAAHNFMAVLMVLTARFPKWALIIWASAWLAAGIYYVMVILPATR
jgi:hypothetical protein